MTTRLGGDNHLGAGGNTPAQAYAPRSFHIMGDSSVKVKLNRCEDSVVECCLLTASQIADYLGVSRSTVYELGLLRKIPQVRLSPTIVRYLRSDVDAWILSRRCATEEQQRRNLDRRSMR